MDSQLEKPSVMTLEKNNSFVFNGVDQNKNIICQEFPIYRKISLSRDLI